MDAKQIISWLSGIFVSILSSTAIAGLPSLKDFNANHTDMYASLLYLQPGSDGLNYAVFTSGNQPFQQSWAYQAIDPSYSPGYEFGVNHMFNDGFHSISLSWSHLNTKDSDSKQVSSGTDLKTVEFVAPEFDVGPAVFGIKRADAMVEFNFDSLKFNLGRSLQPSANLQTKFFAGVGLLRIDQTITTAFSQYAGTPATPYSYALPADPNYLFKIKSQSSYLGAGPDIGFNAQYQLFRNIGLVGEMSGILAAGKSRAKENYTANSTRLIEIGFSPSQQKLTVPDSTDVVVGFDGKLGVFYQNKNSRFSRIRLETGYRLSGYYNPITAVTPTSLVQVGTIVATPEFSTGTMAINSSKVKRYKYDVNGLYLTLGVAL